MTAITTHKDLFVYQKSKQLTIDVIKYFSDNKLDRSKEFLFNQLQRNTEINKMLTGLMKNMKGGSD